MSELTEKKCVPCEGGVSKLSMEQARKLASQIKDWQLDEDKQEICKQYAFKNFYKTMAFVNAVAFIANQENHHPDMCVGYNYCNLTLKTHAVSGLTENDFIVAAKIDQLTQ